LLLVDDIEQRLRALRARLGAMLDATLNNESLQQLEALLIEHGAVQTNSQQALEGRSDAPIGYWLTGTKA
jgi:hypothetical protein